MRVLEGTWEEIAARANEFLGKRVRLVVLGDSETPTPRLPAGIPASHLDSMAGRLDEAEVEALLQAIEEGCERIENEGW
jgi:hypothetical protein